jgi:hypothetical protein
MPERLDRVQIEVGGENVTVQWPARDWLLGELTHHGEQAIVDEFEGVGATGPVSLTTEQKKKLLAVIDHAAEQTSMIEESGERTTGDAALAEYEGIPELQAALRKELGVESS